MPCLNILGRETKQFEEQVNAQKERIQLVKPEFVEDFVEQYYIRLRRGNAIQLGISPSDISMG